MVRITCDRVSFAYRDDVPILQDASLSLEGPAIVGLVGANGAGKSTLLRLFAGALRPTSGQLRVDPPGAAIAVCGQSADALSDEVRAFAERESREAVRWRARLSLRPSLLARFATASPGERRRWQIGAALFAEPEVLLLDEPTNHLDADARRELARALKSYGGLCVVVSHDRDFLDRATGETVRVEGADLSHLQGNYSAAQGAWEAQRASLRAEREEKKRALHHAERALDTARRKHASADANRSSGARMKGPRDHDARSGLSKVFAEWAEDRLGRSVATLGAARARAEASLREAEVPREFGRDVSLVSGHASARRVATLVAPELVAGARTLARDVHVVVERGDRVHLAGPNGAGKSTLLRALRDACTMPRARVVYVPQEISDDAAAEAVAEVRRAPPDARGRVLALVAALGASPERVLKTLVASPGEAKKLALARALTGEVWLALLDEPENHLDLPSIARLEAALTTYAGALVLVTHDDALARTTTDTRLSIVDEHVVKT